MPTPETPRFQRLERALNAWQAHRAAAEVEPIEQFLARHADLRDLLEPLCAEPPRAGLAAAAAPGMPGYQVEGELGRGGMGVVYAATRLCDGRRAAIKVLSGGLVSATARQRFEREAGILRRLDHPHIVRLLDVLDAGDRLCFAMERIDGTGLDVVIARLRAHPVATLTAADLRAAIAGQPLDGGGDSFVVAAVTLVAALAEALEYAHQHGVVHRDVKPANVLVRADGMPVLTDFGIARDEGLPGLTVTGDFAGTPYYVSPEQAMARRAPVDHRTDVFSLGVTLYELLTLRRPFEARTTQEVLGRIVAKEPVDPARLQPAMPPQLSAIVFRALEKDPDNRYPTAAALAADLRAFVARGTVVAKRVPWPVRAARWSRRRPAQAGLLAAGVVALAALATLLTQAPRIAAARAGERAVRLERLLEVAFLEASEGDAAAALSAAERAVAIAGADPEATQILCLAMAMNGRHEQALARLDAAAAAGAADNLLLRAWLHAQAGHQQQADALRAGAPAPVDATACFLASSLDLMAAERGEGQRLRAAFDTALRGVFEAPAPRRLHLAQLAHIAGHLGDRTVAPRVAAALVTLWPDSAHAWFWSGFAVSPNDRAAAIDAYQHAVRLDPDFGLALGNLGSLLERAGRDAEGEVLTRRAIALRPNDPVAHYNLAVVVLKSGRDDEARRELQTALTLRPAYAEAHNNLGTLDLAAGAVDSAIQHLQAALAAREQYPEAHLNLANGLQSQGRDDEAITHLQRALVLRPGYGKAHVLLAMLLTQREQHAAAVPHWRRGAELESRSAQIHALCAEALRMAGARADLVAEHLRWAALEPRRPERWPDLLAALSDPLTPAAARELSPVLELVRAAAAQLPADAPTAAGLAGLLLACGDATAIAAAVGEPEPGSTLAAVLAAVRLRPPGSGR